jgi:hypothetical protein
MHCTVFHDPNFSLTIRKYHCKVCGTAVLGKENIMKHAAEMHDGKGAYQCQYCKKVSLRSMHSEGIYQCHLSILSFVANRNLYGHLESQFDIDSTSKIIVCFKLLGKVIKGNLYILWEYTMCN